MTDALALLASLVLENGTRWGQTAEPWQWADARAVIHPDAVRRTYWLRGRGMSKTTDAAAVALALLLAEAPARSRSHAWAADTDQARIVLDTIAGFVHRTGLAGVVEVGAHAVTVRESGASLVVESSDGASAYGLRPWLALADELALWPSTPNHRRLWAAVVSAMPKVPGSRLVVTTTAGPPSGLGAGVWSDAEESAYWRTSRHPGPAPWWSPEDVASLRADLTASEWRRLIECEFSEGDDVLTNPDDVEACIRPGPTVLPRRAGLEYVAALDVGTRRDLTALAVGHTEQHEAGRVIVIDRVIHWRPADSAGGRVDLTDVEAAALRLCREYRVTRLRFDRMQAEQLTMNLARAGVRTVEYVFSQSGANRLARTLFTALRDRAVSLPDDEELRREATTARLVETGPNVVKMMNPPGFHDDVLTAVGMVLVDLSERPGYAPSGPAIGRPSGRKLEARDTRSVAEALAQPTGRVAAMLVRRRAAEGPRGLPGGAIVMPTGRGSGPSSPQTPRR